MAGIAMPLYFLVAFIGFLAAPPAFQQHGSSGDSGLLLFVLPFFIEVLCILTIVPMVFSILLIRDPHHNTRWGIAITCWWGIVSGYVGLTRGMSGPNFGIDPLYTASQLLPFAGLAGGIWGILWHNDRN
jgi:hypothetical protein